MNEKELIVRNCCDVLAGTSVQKILQHIKQKSTAFSCEVYQFAYWEHIPIKCVEKALKDLTQARFTKIKFKHPHLFLININKKLTKRR